MAPLGHRRFAARSVLDSIEHGVTLHLVGTRGSPGIRPSI